MGASTNSVAGAEYTWATSGFTWNDVIVAERTWAGAKMFDHTLNADDALTIAEHRYWNRLLNFKEYLAFSESLKRSQTRKIAESLGISETYVDYISYWLRVFESVGVAEKLGKAETKKVAEGFGIADKVARSTKKVTSEAIAIAESLKRDQKRSIAEFLSIADEVERNRRLYANESIGVSDKLKRNINKKIMQTLGMAELFGRTVTYNLALTEGFAVSDALRRALTLRSSEAIQVFEEYPRNGNSVISDMILSTDELTLDAFRTAIDAGHAPGYQPFRDFIPGDYTYQQAMFRAVMESKTSDRAKLVELTIQVDVPDVIDRGSAAITNAATGVRVDFNRTFYTVPEVTLTLKGGAVFALPRVLNVDNTGFTAVLRDPDTSNNVTGTFTWAAHGY